MSLILIDNFAFESGGENKEWDIFIDNGTGFITANFIGIGSEPTTVTEAQRGRTVGTEIGKFASSDDADLYVVLASYGTPFAYVSETIPNVPNPPSCDLAFEYVNLTEETQQGANDGTISSLATSSYSDIEYSIVSGVWQSTGNFINLEPGEYTLQSRDSNGCVISTDVIIQAYINPLIKTPIVSVSFANKSRWFAVYNPIAFEFQKELLLIDTVNNITSITMRSGGGILVKTNFLFSSLDIINISKYDQTVVSSFYNFTDKAESIVQDGSGTIFSYPNVVFFGNLSSGTIKTTKERQNYYVEVEVTTQTGMITGKWYPGLNGVTRADISSYLQSLVNARDVFKYDAINWKDPNRSASFQVRYREVWDEGVSDWYSITAPMYVTYSAKQLGDKYGGNMAKYVPFYQENNESRKAEFLTEFIEPVFNAGLPFDLSFIYSESIVGTEIKLRTTSLDINRNEITGGQINSFLLNDEANYLLNAPASKFIISTGTLPPVQNDGIIDALGINRLMIPGDPGIGVEYFKVQLYRGSDDSPYFVTKPLILRVNKPCSNDPYIYVKWINKLGGWDYFRFGFNQEYKINTGNETTIRKTIFDYENDTSAFDIVKKSSNKSITFGASGLSKQESIGLQGMAESINVMMLVNENPYQWLTVELNTGSFNVYQTRGNLFDVKFSLSLPDINIQRQ